MTSPSPKRRRLSTESSAYDERDTLSDNAAIRTPTRPSFLSPTKASLARFNPNLLPRSRRAESQTAKRNQKEDLLERGQQARVYVLGAQTPSVTSFAEQVSNAEQLGQPVPNEQNDQASAGVEKPGAKVAKLDGIGPLVGKSGNAIGLEDEAAQNSTDVFTVEEEEDVDLPQPSSEADAPQTVPDHPPRGILWSSPSKRPRKSKSIFQLGSSPLKSNNDHQSEATVQSHEIRRFPGSTSPHIIRDDPEASGDAVMQLPSNSGLAEPVLPGDDDWSKREERNRLRQQLEELQHDIQLHERFLRSDTEADKSTISAEAGAAELFPLLLRSIHKSHDAPIDRKPSLSTMLNSFLPFAHHTQSESTPEPDHALSNLPTHRPVDIANPFPYLRLFTPLDISSSISLPPQPTKPIHQLHFINLATSHKLLVARLQLTLDTSTHTVVTLSLDSISPWADQELGSWIRANLRDRDISRIGWAIGSFWEMARRRVECWSRCEDAFPNRSSNLLKEQNGKRADLVDQIEDMEQKPISRAKRGRPTGSSRMVPGKDVTRPRESSEENRTTNASKISRAPQKTAQKVLRRATLRRLIGSQIWVLRGPEVELRVHWRIGFDWTGEAESDVGVSVAVPGPWREADERSSLAQIPALFDRLVRGRGVFQAVTILVGLLFS